MPLEHRRKQRKLAVLQIFAVVDSDFLPPFTLDFQAGNARRIKSEVVNVNVFAEAFGKGFRSRFRGFYTIAVFRRKI